MLSLCPNKNQMMEWLLAFLEENTDDFKKFRQDYLECLTALQTEVGDKLPFVNEYDDVLTQQLAGELLFSFNLGLTANKKYSENSLANDILKMDYEVYLRESVAHLMPGYLHSEIQMDNFHKQLTPEQNDSMLPVIEYKSYLQSYGPKIAHFFGFLYGDTYLSCVEPNYYPNRFYTRLYQKTLEEALDMKLLSEESAA